MNRNSNQSIDTEIKENLVNRLVFDCANFIKTVSHPNPLTTYDGNVFTFNNAMVSYRQKWFRFVKAIIPFSFYNISVLQENNLAVIEFQSDGQQTVTLPNGFYRMSDLRSTLEEGFSALGHDITVRIEPITYKMVITVNDGDPMRITYGNALSGEGNLLTVQLGFDLQNSSSPFSLSLTSTNIPDIQDQTNVIIRSNIVDKGNLNSSPQLIMATIPVYGNFTSRIVYESQDQKFMPCAGGQQLNTINFQFADEHGDNIVWNGVYPLIELDIIE